MQSLIDALEQLLDRAMHIPASGKVLVDESEARQIIEQLRQLGLSEVAASQQRDRILADARLQARRIMEEAQGQVNVRLEGEGAVQAARERARTIVADAEQQASRVRADANAYVANQLGALENRLQRILHEVQSGQRYLAQPPADRQSPAETGRHS